MPTARAVIAHESFEEKISSVVMDLSAAYPNAVSAWRGFVVIDRRHVLIVDEIVPKTCLSSVDWQMHTLARVELRNAAAALIDPVSDSTEASRFYLRIIDPAEGEWTLGSATPLEPPGQNANAGVAKLVLQLEQVAQPLRLAVLLTPDAGACASPELPSALRRPLSEWAGRL